MFAEIRTICCVRGDSTCWTRATPGTTSAPAVALLGRAPSGQPLSDHGIEAEPAGAEQRDDEREDGEGQVELVARGGFDEC